jgi:hypothetical protein
MKCVEAANFPTDDTPKKSEEKLTNFQVDILSLNRNFCSTND